ncbi:MAG: T9SS type A sorting domain-containing protein [Psychroserpens sp.]|uniref:zinc-dependent metalloprotease n=1 Tax=Psychroserpens sp. TaxID=2020870 RepID=UPI00300364F1
MDRKTTLTKTLLFAFTLLLCSFAYAQDRSCGMVEYMEQQMQDPDFAKQYELGQEKFKAKLQQFLSEENFSERRGITIEIPVAVHFPTANEADRDCLETLAQNQIDIINADYTASNSDFSLWTAAAGLYPGTNAGVANISFCLAVSNHPVGLDPELLEGEPAITIGYDFGGGNNIDGNWGGYMNFVVRPLGGVLGFSPLGGSIGAGQAVTISTTAFGSGSGCIGSGVVPNFPYNLGRTTTHELGHFYNLNHTFNVDGPGGVCGVGGDGIADTPEVVTSTYGCPAAGTVAGCAGLALTMNYMDYVNDACMYMFSAGQATVMDAWVASIASQIKPGVCTPALPGFTLTANNSPILSCPDTDTQAVFDLSFTAIQGFSESTTFSASGVPANATVAFSPTSLSSTGNFTMTIGNLGATTQGEYTITVTGTSATKIETTDVLLKNTCTSIQCDTYASAQNLALPIADGSGGTPGQPLLVHIINIPDLATIESMTINVDVTHTYVSDLIVRIIHPDETTFIDVFNGDCGSNGDFDITFDDEAGTLVCGSPTIGTFAPGEALSAFTGLEAQGDWTILIADFWAGDTGTLNDWSIEICAESALSVDDLALEDFAIFPNPNEGEFTVKLNSNSGNAINIDVHDIRGRRIFTNAYTNGSDFNQTVKLNNVQSGLYLVTVRDGDRQITKKIVVE